MTFVSELEPQAVWRHFDHILTIPRGSKNEGAMGEYVAQVAERCGLTYRKDSLGNVVVGKPAGPGLENVPVTVLQSHLDMVNEKNADVQHDFSRDPIQPRRDGEYLKATGTTLGSDNGIGVASALALMEAPAEGFGPLEFLFTVDEETGLTGAGNLSADFLSGRRLINMDSEEEGALYVGCAGGAGVNLDLPFELEPQGAGRVLLEVHLRGLKGGHSGVDIHLQRGNAVKLLARMLRTCSATHSLRLRRFDGGNMHNAIPREASAQLSVSDQEEENLRGKLESLFQEIREEYRKVDPGMQLDFGKSENGAGQVLASQHSARLLQLLDALPHGVMVMSYDIPDLVETSSNLATVSTKDDTVHIHVSNRSSVAAELQAIQQRVQSIGLLAGAEVETVEGYPGWKPNMDSPLLRVVREVHRDVMQRDPEVKAIHAGLECGIIGEKYPGMDMISFGPQIEFPHSPDERVHIESVARFYHLLNAVLKRLAREEAAGSQ